jgi:hypothetical protein
MSERKSPQVVLSECPESYARLCAQGWDSVQEALCMKPTALMVSLLEAGQARAQKDDESDGVSSIELNGDPWRIRARGTRRFRWFIENDDLQIFLGSPTLKWGVSIRYLAAGLWEHGWQVLRERALEALRPYTTQNDPDFLRVTRADWCFDFYSPALKAELHPGAVANVVCHSSAKKFETQTVSVGDVAQTITVGTRASLQVQLYDKTREIDEKSGKTWLYEVWVEGLDGEWPWADRPTAIFRLECRFFSEFLKQRNVRRPHEVMAAREELVAEALKLRRLTVPPTSLCGHCGQSRITDDNRWRWPMHPIWSEAYRKAGVAELLPLGAKITGRRAALVDLADKQLAGSARSAEVLQFGDFDRRSAERRLRRVLGLIESDPHHQKKVNSAQDRYSDVEDAR